jgi:hypothetical protein
MCFIITGQQINKYACSPCCKIVTNSCFAQKKEKFQLIFTFLIMKFHFFGFLEERRRIKKKILPGFVKHTLVK